MLYLYPSYAAGFCNDFSFVLQAPAIVVVLVLLVYAFCALGAMLLFPFLLVMLLLYWRHVLPFNNFN